MFIINKDFEYGLERDTFIFQDKEEAVARFLEECQDSGEHLYVELRDEKQVLATWEWGDEGIRVTGFTDNGFAVPENYMDGSFVVMEDEEFLVEPEHNTCLPWDFE